MDIRAKIVMIVSLILLLAVGVSTMLFMDYQRTRLIQSKTTDVEVLGDIIHRGIEDSMSRGETQVVQRVVENIGRSPELLSLRILSPEGMILKSRDVQEIGSNSLSFPLIGNITDRDKTIAKDTSITLFSPIPNSAECHRCHAETEPLNGIIEVEFNIQRSTAEVAASRRAILFTGVLTVFTVAFILAFIISRLILKPLSLFKQTMRSVGSGDIDARMPIIRDDDLGLLARSFNQMLDELGNLYTRDIKKEKEMTKVKAELSHKSLLEDLNRELQYKVLEAESANKAVLKLSKEVKSKNIELEGMVNRLKRINDIGRVLASVIETAELLKVIVKTASKTLKADHASIYVTRDKQRTMTMEFADEIGARQSDRTPSEINPLYQEILSEGRQVLINNSPTDPGNEPSHIGSPLKMRGRVIGGILLTKDAGRQGFAHEDMELLDTISNQAIVALENAWLYETVKVNYFGTIQSLVNALEASDRYTKGHSERVRFMVLELARHIGLDARELEILEHAAILHDIGKIGIDTSVLNKEDDLTNSEFSLIKAHPIIGDEILGPIGTLQSVRTTILQHHERYDGNGYPYGIAGEEITLKARLLAVIDTFDAMVTDRPYRQAIPFLDVLEELRKSSGTQFDPMILNAFLEMIKEKEAMLQEAGYNLR